MFPHVSRGLNVTALMLVLGALIAAFWDQLVKHELPCPLCLLQRAALFGVGLGVAMNLRFGAKPLHYALVGLASLVGLVIAGRQTLLHVAPGAGGYGEALWGLHLYVWAFLLFAAIAVGTVFMVLWEWGYGPAQAPGARWRALATALSTLLCGLALANGLATALECAAGLCPADPIHYLLLD